MGMKARRNLVPAMAALLGLSWGMTARGQDFPGTVRGQIPGYPGATTARFSPYAPAQPGGSSSATSPTSGFLNPTAITGDGDGDDDDLTQVQETPPVTRPSGLQPSSPYGAPSSGLQPNTSSGLQPNSPYGAPSSGLKPSSPYGAPSSGLQTGSPYGAPPSGLQLAGPNGASKMGMLPNVHDQMQMPADPGHQGPGPCPRELTPTSHPPYTIAPPDILYLDAIRLIPKPPYRIEPLEILLLNVTDTLPNQPIVGQFVVTPEGTINLGFNYGSVRVGGMTLSEAQTAIRNQLARTLRNPQVTLALAQFRGLQQVRGQHLIRPDGTISLGTYGSVYVAGLTLGQAKCVIEQYLSKFLLDPEISVDVLAYNSKVYYVIFDGGGFGQRVYRLPVTGNETVMDAIGMVGGLDPVASKKRIWLARPAPADHSCSQILPVDWQAITMAGQTRTNYQIFPGDRIYVSANRLIEFNNYLSMVLAPVERILGVTLLGASTVFTIRSNPNNNNNGAIFIP
jgi:protein involved in polysaccharide export with SLBB domain